MALSSAATQHGRLIPFDILGSIAHVDALRISGVVSSADRDGLVDALQQIRADVLKHVLPPLAGLIETMAILAGFVNTVIMTPFFATMLGLGMNQGADAAIAPDRSRRHGDGLDE